MMVSFPAGIVQDFAIILNPMQLSFKEMFLCSSNEFQVGNYRLEHRGIPDFEGQLCKIWVIGNDLNYSRGKTNW